MTPTKKRKIDHNDQENKKVKVVVGRKAFNEYWKIRAAKAHIVKIDNEFRKAVALEWHTLSHIEKAKYYVPSENTSKADEDTPKSSMTLLTRCSPQRFREIVSTFSKNQIDAVNEMGFGTLVQMLCTRLRRDVCYSLIDNFDTDSCTIKLYGSTRTICSSNFKQIMGVPEGGSNIDFEGSINDNGTQTLSDFYFGTSECISVSYLSKKLKEVKTADDKFKVGFILLALSTLLCPNTSINVHPKYLIPLRDPKNIRSLNWARFLFNFLIDRVRTFKHNKSGYLSGFVLFFQLYYYDSVIHGKNLIDCSKSALAAWEDVKSAKLLKWISRKGGIGSSKVALIPKFDGVMTDMHGIENVLSLKANVEFLKNGFGRIENSLEVVKRLITTNE